MLLVETHNINKKHVSYDEIDKLSFLSKNLFNMALYNIRQHYFATNTFLDFKANYDLVKNIQKNDYEALPRKVSNQVLKQVYTTYTSFFKALKSYAATPSKFKAKPCMPRYKDKVKGRNILNYEKGAVSRKSLKKGYINLSGTSLAISTKVKFTDLKEVRIVKRVNSYVVEVIYEVKDVPLKQDNGRYASCDLGLNNLVALTFNKGQRPLLINGRPLKSINQYYNKELARLKSELELKNKQKTSKRIKKLTDKRNNKIKDYLHKASRMMVNQLALNDITKLVIGKNDGWKQDINIGKRNNQNFVQVPFNNLISYLEYKLQLEGIQVIKTTEEYTSKCSFIDSEEVKKHEQYKGKRVKRGLFITEKGIMINADINGSYNIFIKAIPNAFAEGIEGLAVNPLKLKLS